MDRGRGEGARAGPGTLQRYPGLRSEANGLYEYRQEFKTKRPPVGIGPIRPNTTRAATRDEHIRTLSPASQILARGAF